MAREINFDGIIGPTHHYGGLSEGNIASRSSGGKTSNPKAACLQGLKKMKFLYDLGIGQGVLPPHERPLLSGLKVRGYSGTAESILKKVSKESPHLLAQYSSASAMWAANCATVSPSADTLDSKVHFTAANLISNPHRALETEMTCRILKKLFDQGNYFAHHHPLPADPSTSDEGSANYVRLANSHGEPGIELFVYGKDEQSKVMPKRFPARQTAKASKLLAGQHELKADTAVFAQQNPNAIDLGVFHNDVISVGNENVYLVHEESFVNQPSVLNQIQERCQFSLVVLSVRSSDLSVSEAVKSYLFNSQLVTLPKGGMLLLAPIECQESAESRQVIEKILADKNPIQSVEYVDLRESMRNGGGPACLRLRVVLTPEELTAVHQPCLLTDTLYEKLVHWVEKHYRDRLASSDLADPALLHESYTALDELTKILQLGSLYDFQKGSITFRY